MNIQEIITRAALAMLPLCAAQQASASPDYPNKPIRIVVAYAPGGPTDIVARFFAQELGTKLSQPVLVENRAGAGTLIGTESVIKAAPDGYTLFWGTPATVITPLLHKNPTYDVLKDLQPVSLATTQSMGVLVSANIAINSISELVKYAKANPGKVTYASQGNGSTSHLTAALFMQLTGTEMTHIPYRGTAPALTDLLGGQVDVFFDNLSSSAQYHTAGKLRILAVADSVRSTVLPQVPTFEESKVAGMNAVTFFSVVAPPGTPPATAAAMQKLLADAMAMPDVKARFAEQGAEARGWSPEQTARFIQTESDKWNKVIKGGNLVLAQ